MKKLAIGLTALVVAFATGTALAQGRGGGNGGSGGGHGGHGGGMGGGYSGGGKSSGGYYSGGGKSWGGYHGGGYRGGWGGGYRGGWGGGHQNVGYPGGWYGNGWRGGGWYGSGWRGAWYSSSVGVVVGGPAYWGAFPYPYFAPYPAYYPYATFPYAASDQDNYVQQTPNETPPAQSDYWYYCTEPAGYYPYVQRCSRPWMQVIPQRDGGAPSLAPAP